MALQTKVDGLPSQTSYEGSHGAQQGGMVRLTTGQEITLSRLLSWAQKGGLAIVDQGLFSGANFIVNVLLARWLEPAQYGAFILAYSMFLFLGAVHTAVLTEPMAVFGAGKYAEKFREYLGILIYGHWGVTGIIALVLALLALAFWGLHSAAMARVLVGLALASPFILFLWLVRRAFYVTLRPEWSAVGGVLYVLLMIAGLYGLYRQQWLSSTSALLVMGGSSLVVSMGFLGLLQPSWSSGIGNPSVGMVLSDHWRYGRWAVSSEALLALHNNIYIVIVTALLGFASIAALKAVQNLVTPVGQFINALTLLFVPNSARHFSQNGASALMTDAVSISVALSLAAFTYWLMAVIAGPTVVNMLYTGKYDEYAGLIYYVAFVPVLTALRVGPNVIQKAAQRSDLVLITHLCTTCFSFLTAWFFIIFMGVFGAAIGMNIATFLGVVIAWFLLCQQKKAK